MIEIDKDLFCDMVKFYGEAFHLPPLAAKIYSYLPVVHLGINKEKDCPFD